MADLLCVDGNFSEDQKAFWMEKGVKYPEQDKVYTFRDSVNHSHGEIGIRVEEIVNPPVLVKHSILGTAMIEPTFHIRRFAKLNGEEITKEELKEIMNETLVRRMV